jgi:hypothetical protein
VKWITLNESGNDVEPFTNVITVRPDFLVNHKDDSHLVSVNSIYTPIKNYGPGVLFLNSVEDHIFGDIQFEPIADIRLDFGHYAQVGNEKATDYNNYWRTGPRLGFSFDSKYPQVPLQLTVTEVYLYGMSGALSRVDYFKAVLSYKIVGKFISLDASFGNGRREDTGVAEHIWSIAIAGAY